MRMLTILLLLASSFRAVADFEAASQAYRNNDYPAAFEAFSELARNGDARSQTVLAIMYKYGESTAIDLEQAFHWYLEAALQGYPPAQYNVGIMLIEGVGVPADPEAAKEWLSRAVDSGYEGARAKLSMLTGDVEIVTVSEPAAWSQNWNLRLPNDIRFQSPENEVNRYKTYRIQLGAMSSIAGAERLWRQVLASSDSLFRGFDSIYREGKSGTNTVWRVQSGNFSSASSAGDFCSRYKANPRNKTGCIVVSE
jgi:TPR repeat protein